MPPGRTEDELKSLIRQDPGNDSFRIELEELLAKKGTQPVSAQSTLPQSANSVMFTLMRREREFAESLDQGKSIDHLIVDYNRFVFDHGIEWYSELQPMYRPFALWLVACEPSRRFALNVAVAHKANLPIGRNSLPLQIMSGKMSEVHALKDGILEFVRRYRGPTGKEPPLADNEIELRIFASYSRMQPMK